MDYKKDFDFNWEKRYAAFPNVGVSENPPVDGGYVLVPNLPAPVVKKCRIIDHLARQGFGLYVVYGAETAETQIYVHVDETTVQAIAEAITEPIVGGVAAWQRWEIADIEVPYWVVANVHNWNGHSSEWVVLSEDPVVDALHHAASVVEGAELLEITRYFDGAVRVASKVENYGWRSTAYVFVPAERYGDYVLVPCQNEDDMEDGSYDFLTRFELPAGAEVITQDTKAKAGKKIPEVL